MSSEIVKDAERIMADCGCRLRVRRSTRKSRMLPKHLAQMTILALHAMNHFKEKGVTVKKRAPLYINRVIGTIKKLGGKLEPSEQGPLGQGRQRVKKIIKAPIDRNPDPPGQGRQRYKKKKIITRSLVRNADPSGQGRRRLNDIIMAPQPMAKLFDLFLKIYNLFDVNNAWNKVRKMPAPLDQLLNGLNEFQRRNQG